MTLTEMSGLYRDSAAVIHQRIADLRLAVRQEEDPETARLLRQRIAELVPLLRESRELAILTAHYYDRSYHKHERYTL